MAEPFSDVERAILKTAASAERIVRLESRIARLKAGGRPTKIYDALLATLRDSLSLMKAHLGHLTGPMVGYRCYLMTGEAIHDVQIFECPDDAEVIIKAAALLESKPRYDHVEIWEGKRQVARLPRRVSVD